MTANLGKTDRLIRFVIGFLLLFLPLMNVPQIWSNGWAAFGSMLIGGILIATSFVRFCPLYRLVGVSTC